MPLAWYQQKDENGSIEGGVKQVPGGRICSLSSKSGAGPRKQRGHKFLGP